MSTVIDTLRTIGLLAAFGFLVLAGMGIVDELRRTVGNAVGN